MTLNFEMSLPDSVFDWVAYRELVREYLDTIDVELVAALVWLVYPD